MRDVVVVGFVLEVFKDRAEEGEALAGEEADLSDQTGDRSRGECAAAETDEEDLVAGSPIYGDEGVAFADICFEAKASCSAYGSADHASLRSDPCLVVDYLRYAISTCVFDCPAETRYVARWLLLAVQ